MLTKIIPPIHGFLITVGFPAYPTLGEINKKVVGTYFSGKIVSDRVKKALKLFFNFKGRACG